MASVTCGLTAEDRDQLRNPTIVSSMGLIFDPPDPNQQNPTHIEYRILDCHTLSTIYCFVFRFRQYFRCISILQLQILFLSSTTQRKNTPLNESSLNNSAKAKPFSQAEKEHESEYANRQMRSCKLRTRN